MNKLLLAGYCCAALLARAEAVPIPPGRGDKAVTSQLQTTRAKTSEAPPAKATIGRSADQTAINMAMDLACTYSSSYQFRDTDIVQVFCSDRLSADADFKQSLSDDFKQHSKIVLEKIVLRNLASTSDMVLLREDLDWKQTNSKTGLCETAHTARTLRMITDGQRWAVDDDQPATSDVDDAAHEIILKQLGKPQPISIATSLSGDAIVSSLLNQIQKEYVQKYDFYHSVEAYGWALSFAKEDLGKTTGASLLYANTLSSLAYAEVNAGNYAAATDDKALGETYYQGAVRHYQEFLVSVQKDPTLSTPASVMGTHDWLAVAYQGLGQYDQALTYRRMALGEGTAQNNQAVIGDALVALASLEGKNKGKAAELQCYQDYCRQQEAADDKSALAAALLQIGVFYRVSGEYAPALSSFKRAEELEGQLGDDNGVANALTFIAGLYDYQVDFASAESSCKQAQVIYMRTHNNAALADTWRCLSHYAYEQGQYAEALEDAFTGLKLVDSQNNLSEMVRLYECIGSTFQGEGDFRQAAMFLQACEQNAALLNDNVFENSAIGTLATLFLGQGDYDSALYEMNKSQAIEGRISDPHELRSNFRVLANIWHAKGDDTQAFSYLQEALEKSRSEGPSWETAAAYSSEGYILKGQGHHDGSLEAFTKALDIAGTAKAWPIAAGAQREIGNAYGRDGKYPEALRQYQEALKLTGPSELVSLADNYGDIGYVLFRMKQYDDAEKACRKAIEYIETLRAQVAGGPREQQLFFQNNLNPYQTLMLILNAQHHNQDAFSCLEQSKARVVRASYGIHPVMTAPTPDELAQSRSLAASLTSLDTQVLYLKRQNAAPPVLAPIENDQLRARLASDLWQTILYSRHVQPEHLQNDPPVTCDDAYRLLPNGNSAVLEYAVLGNVTYLFLLTKQGHPQCNVYCINIDAGQLTARVKQFRDWVAGRDDRPEFHAEARSLFELLLGGPVKDKLKGITTLCIVPDGPLWDLPFQALQPSDGHYVLETQTVFFTPSLTALRDMRRKQYPGQSRTGPVMLAVGNPALAKQITAAHGVNRTAPATAEVMNDLYQPLPQAEKQVRQIAALYGKPQCRVLLGEAATEERVRSEMENYQILQFATHGVANAANPLYSFLLLSQADQERGRGGMLYAADVMKMHLHARLVVLAACDTAHGKVSPGEGLIGMSWAFLHAGCPHVVASQWQIDAGPTTKLMVAFHGNLHSSVNADADGAMIAEALRNAALKLRWTALYSHPYYWAPFVLTGDGFPAESTGQAVSRSER